MKARLAVFAILSFFYLDAACANTYCGRGSTILGLMTYHEYEELVAKKVPVETDLTLLAEVNKNCTSGETISIPISNQELIGEVCDFSQDIVPIPFVPSGGSDPELDEVANHVVICVIK